MSRFFISFSGVFAEHTTINQRGKMNIINEHKVRTIKLLHGWKLITCLCLFDIGASVNPAFAATGIDDVYFLSGKVRPVVGVWKENNKWSDAPFTLSLGLERNPGSKKRLLSAYNVVVDATQLTGRIPGSCAQKFSVPWDVVKRQFPKDKFTGKRDRPEEKNLWEGESGQVIHVNGTGCTVTLLIGPPADYSVYDTTYIAQQFPGLPSKNVIYLKGDIRYQRGGRVRQRFPQDKIQFCRSIRIYPSTG